MTPLDPSLLAAALLIVTLAAVLQGTTGMGFGLVAAPALIWIYPSMVPTTVLLMGFVVSAVGACREWEAVAPKQLSIAIVGRVTGALLAVPLLVVTSNTNGFSIVFGLLILLAVVLSLLGRRPILSKETLLIAGTVSGLMGTVTSVGAPPMGLVFQDQAATSARPTLNAFFTVGSVISLLALGYLGRFSLDHVILAGVLAPGFVGGVYLSKYFYGYVDDRYRRVILLFCSVSAVALICRSLF